MTGNMMGRITKKLFGMPVHIAESLPPNTMFIYDPATKEAWRFDMAKNAEKKKESVMFALGKKGSVLVAVPNTKSDSNRMRNYQIHVIKASLLTEANYIATVPTAHDVVGIVKAYQAGQENPDAKG